MLINISQRKVGHIIQMQAPKAMVVAKLGISLPQLWFSGQM